MLIPKAMPKAYAKSSSFDLKIFLELGVILLSILLINLNFESPSFPFKMISFDIITNISMRDADRKAYKILKYKL